MGHKNICEAVLLKAIAIVNAEEAGVPFVEFLLLVSAQAIVLLALSERLITPNLNVDPIAIISPEMQIEIALFRA